jgi:hypothetical protein
MSKQFQIYALPNDVEDLIQKLRIDMDIELISPISPRPELMHLLSPIRNSSLLEKERSVSINCYMLNGDLADVRLKQFPGDAVWHIDDRSEVVNLSGFDFDGDTLVRGRMYFQSDYIEAGVIYKKREFFLRWANELFRRSKKMLTRSQDLNAYVGREAYEWARQGGRLASFAVLGRPPIYERRLKTSKTS